MATTEDSSSRAGPLKSKLDLVMEFSNLYATRDLDGLIMLLYLLIDERDRFKFELDSTNRIIKRIEEIYGICLHYE